MKSGMIVLLCLVLFAISGCGLAKVAALKVACKTCSGAGTCSYCGGTG